jgi:hypothetical protein
MALAQHVEREFGEDLRFAPAALWTTKVAWGTRSVDVQRVVDDMAVRHVVPGERDIHNMLRLVSDLAAVTSAGSWRCDRMLQALGQLTAASVVVDVDVLGLALSGEPQILSFCAWGLTGQEALHLGRHHQPEALPDRFRALLGTWLGPIKAQLQVMARSAAMDGAAMDGAVMDGAAMDGWATAEAFPATAMGRYAFSVLPRAAAGTAHLLAVGRGQQDPAMTEREARIVRCLHQPIDRLCHPADSAAASNPYQLPPYLQRLLPELLAGTGEKQIAAKLGYTFNTVHQYIRAIYRRLGVSSRAEFMARCLADVRQQQQIAPAPGSRDASPARPLGRI